MPDKDASPVIGGPRVRLRPLEPHDADCVQEWTNDAEVARGRPVLAPLSRAQADRHVAALLEEHDQSAYHFVIEIDTASPRPIGTISLQRLDRTNGSASIDVVIGDRSAWGAGYGGEAISALLDFGFDSLRLHRIWLLVYADNERAIRSYERLGFRREGIFRDGVFRHGAYHDVHEMAVLEDGWRQRRASPPIGGQ